jgi:hypothetical protein
MVQSAWSKTISPTSRPGPDENLPTVSTLKAFQHAICHHCTHHGRLIAEICVGDNVLLKFFCFLVFLVPVSVSQFLEQYAQNGGRVPNTYGGVHVLEWLLQLEILACQHLHVPLQLDWTTPSPLTRLRRYIFVCFKSFMVDVEAWAGRMSSGGVHTCHTPD